MDSDRRVPERSGYEPRTRETHYLAKRIGLLLLILLASVSSVFLLVHIGPMDPADETAALPEQQAELEEKKEDFGLTESLRTQYRQYLVAMFTFDFGESWTGRWEAVEQDETEIEVSTLLSRSGIQTGWLWLVTFSIVSGGLLLFIEVSTRRTRWPMYMDAGLLATTAVPTFVLAVLLYQGLISFELLFGVEWTSLFIETKAVESPRIAIALSTPEGFVRSLKLALPPALSLGIPILLSLFLMIHPNMRRRLKHVRGAEARGLSARIIRKKHVFPYVGISLVHSLREILILLLGGTIIVEHVFGVEGLGWLFINAVSRWDFTTLQALLFLTFLLVLGSILLRDVVVARADLDRRQEQSLSLIEYIPFFESVQPEMHSSRRSGPTELSPIQASHPTRDITETLKSRLFILWFAAAIILFVLEIGTAIRWIHRLLPWIADGAYPTLLDRSVISNHGHRTADGSWTGTFLGLSPAIAWVVRVVVVYLYALLWACWLLIGYILYIRYARGKWLDIPWHDFRTLLAGGIIFVTVSSAIFAPTIAPVPPEHTNAPVLDDRTQFSANDQLRYYDQELGRVTTIQVAVANSQSASLGIKNYGPLSYDEFGRFHPLGTTTSGTDLLTELLYGLRIYLLISGLAMATSMVFTLVSGFITGYFGQVGARGINSIVEFIAVYPLFPIALLLSKTFDGTWISSTHELLLFLGFLFGVLAWPLLWRSVRINLSKLGRETDVRFGVSLHETSHRQRGRLVLKSLKTPLVAGGLSVATGAIIATGALSFVGGDIIRTMPTEWATLIIAGEQYVTTSSWHVTIVPALSFLLLIGGTCYVSRWTAATEDRSNEHGISPLDEIIKRGGGG